MRAGTPVVLSDVVGNRDVVEHRVSGLLVPAADPDALAAAVVELLLDPELGASLASAARTRVREAFDVAEQGRALSALYQQLARP
jgi:glycosyltransferase involved in cell wall biosynthesis